ncbi:unnamed protein product, partial [Oppiella nova]
DACISDNCGIGDFSAITNKDIKLALKGYKGPKNEKFKGYCLHPDRESCIPNEITCFKDKDCCSDRSSPYLTRNFNHWSKKGVKGPKPIPGFGNILSPFLTEQIILEKDWIKKYGKIYGTFEANKPILTIADPALIKQIMATDSHANKPILTIADPALIKQIMATDSHVFNINVTDPILQAPAHPILSKTLVASNGQDWRRVRSLFSPAFSTSKMKTMFAQMRECLTLLLNNLEPYAMGTGREVELKTMYGNYTMDAIATCAFGTKLNGYTDASNPFVVNATRVFTPNPVRQLLSMILPPFVLKMINMRHIVHESAHEFFFEMTRRIMNERKKSDVKYNDFMGLVMSAEYSDQSSDHYKNPMDINSNITNEKGGNPGDSYITNEEILANSWDFFTTGYETTATTLAFATYELSLQQDVQQKLYEEIQSSVDSDGEVDYELIQKMPFLDAVVTETLRLHSITLRVGRMAGQDYKLGDTGITLEKGQTVEIPVYGIHHCEEFYPNPSVFDPKRFLPENSHKLIPYTYLPFGGGHRTCIGMRFAIMLIKLALVHVMLRYRFVTSKNTDIPVLLKQAGLSHTPERL